MIFSRHHVWRGELGWRDSWFVTKVGAPVITYMDSILLIIWERTESESKSMVLHTFSSEYTYINNNYNEYNKLSVFVWIWYMCFYQLTTGWFSKKWRLCDIEGEISNWTNWHNFGRKIMSIWYIFQIQLLSAWIWRQKYFFQLLLATKC